MTGEIHLIPPTRGAPRAAPQICLFLPHLESHLVPPPVTWLSGEGVCGGLESSRSTAKSRQVLKLPGPQALASPARRASARTGPGGPEGRPGRLAGARPRLAGRPRGGRGGAACSAPGAPQLHAVFSHAFSFCTEKLLQRALCKVGRHPV